MSKEPTGCNLSETPRVGSGFKWHKHRQSPSLSAFQSAQRPSWNAEFRPHLRCRSFAFAPMAQIIKRTLCTLYKAMLFCFCEWKKKGGPPKPGETVSHCCHLVFQLKLWSCTYRTSKSGCMDEASNLHVLVGVDGVKYSDWMLRWDRTTCCASCSLCHSYFTLGRLGSIKTH